MSILDDKKDDNLDERAMPSVNKHSAGGTGNTLGVIAFVGIVVVALVAVNGGFSKSDEDKQKAVAMKEQKKTVESNLPPLQLPPPPPAPKKAPKPIVKPIVKKAPPPIVPKIQDRQISRSARQEKIITPEMRRMQKGLLADTGNSGRGSRTVTPAPQNFAGQSGSGFFGQGASAAQADDSTDNLNKRLEPTQLEGARASIIQDRNLFITKGTFIDCALETALSSDVPGQTACRITRNVYSTSGKVVLLERGSKVVGEYRSNLKRGQSRLFVLWTRVETPNGVIVNLDSPGTDSLGRAGTDGYIDTHFWERFGSAIMLSLISDIGRYISNRALSDAGDTVHLGDTSGAAQDSAAIAVENSVNIPPTLVKNQGEHINIFVARDLDFRSVYDVVAAR